MLIDSSDKLLEVCETLLNNKPEFIAVDTEFMRGSSCYYPKLCLIQIFHSSISFIVDVLKAEINLSPLEEIFNDKSIIKIFHSCRQDIESLLTRFINIPNPIFDTQIAEMFCNYHENLIGYSKLVEKFFDKTELNKIAFKNTDWTKRPLSQMQLDYAYYDVSYLYEIYNPLHNTLREKGRLYWFLEEMETLKDIGIYKINAENCYNMFRFPENVTQESIIIINSILEMREIIAQTLNMNRNTIINNQSIYSLHNRILSSDNLEVIHNYVKKPLLSKAKVDFLKILNKNRSRIIPNYQIFKMDYNKPALNILLVLLYNMCTESEISQKLVASQHDLIEAITEQPDIPLMKGWRYEFFGHHIENFLKGKSKILVSAEKPRSENIKVNTEVISNS